MFMHVMGILLGLGCKINFAEGGHLTDTCPTYMYDYNNGEYVKQSLARAKAQLAEDERAMSQLDIRAAYARGMIEAFNTVMRREQWL